MGTDEHRSLHALRWCLALNPQPSRFVPTPTRYESVGCDDENFSSPKESQARLNSFCECSQSSTTQLLTLNKFIARRIRKIRRLLRIASLPLASGWFLFLTTNRHEFTLMCTRCASAWHSTLNPQLSTLNSQPSTNLSHADLEDLRRLSIHRYARMCLRGDSANRQSLTVNR